MVVVLVLVLVLVLVFEGGRGIGRGLTGKEHHTNVHEEERERHHPVQLCTAGHAGTGTTVSGDLVAPRQAPVAQWRHCRV